jgi:dCMP deaminase
MSRQNWHQYFLNLARQVAQRGTCLRRNYGAVIVDEHKVIVSTGYTGAPRGRTNCIDKGFCKRQELGVPSGERYELCESVHAEMNAVINGSPERMRNGIIYVAGIDGKLSTIAEASKAGKQIGPCLLCSRVIINAQIKKIVVPSGNEDGYEILLPDGLNR